MKMFKKTAGRLLALAMIMTMVLAFAACGAPEEEDAAAPVENPVNVTMEIVIGLEAAAEGGFEGLAETAFVVEEGSNLQEAFLLFCKANDISITVNEDIAYVTEIMGLTEKDYVETTGWIFQVNGEVPSVPAAEIVLVEGDKITWEFVDFATYSW